MKSIWVSTRRRDSKIAAAGTSERDGVLSVFRED